MRSVIVVHYDEIALKGGNRHFFEDLLVRGIKRVVSDIVRVQVKKLYGRFVVPVPEGADSRTLVERLKVLPGVRYLLEGMQCDEDLDVVTQAIDAVLPESGVATFGVRVRRADKRYPISASEIERRLGAHINDRMGWGVDLTAPDLWVRIELVNKCALVCTRRHEGPGGLPEGTSGRGVTLLSGGIDSPVAAWMMMTRGLRLTAIHFHSAPFTSRASQEKVEELAEQLSRFQPRLDLVMIPFADPIQKAVVEKAPQKYRVILYRRFMMRLAGGLAQRIGARCIVTGEALGQVASQTIENLTTVEAVAPVPVLRPLIGMTKAEIIQRARNIGTFETSIQPHEDCCSYLMPRKPVTRTTPEELDEVEAAFDVEALVRETWHAREERKVRLEEAGS